MEMDQQKVSIVREWPVQKSVNDVQQFLGLTGYYRKFIKDHAELAFPLYKLLNKGVTFEWEAEQQLAFESLEQQSPTIQSSCYLTGLHHMKYIQMPRILLLARSYIRCVFESHKLTPGQSRYATHEKELLAVVHALKARHALTAKHHVGGPNLVKTDHATLKWFNTQPKLTQRQTRWSIAMQENDI
jgi:hypothetical protein